jgi:diaminohydroxyphosphoribosylaminopyrimidine deaminase / 5-amino-6-(5-phosphoribosylamino)uracil reductase
VPVIPDVDRRWLLVAIEESRRCRPTEHAYSVGAAIVDAAGRELARGYSREGDEHEHAEEAALAKLGAASDLSGATIYTSLEPCGVRRSRPRTCAQLILDAGLRRVVFALREPPLLAAGQGAVRLAEAGIEVVELADLAEPVRRINAHLLEG